ncbi:MAG: sarcosine oxidase subunit gamma [Rhodobacteraceae bacterium]|nr:sarcosine oxidase subunit gamma [Paracoccaceae bacterium]
MTSTFGAYSLSEIADLGLASLALRRGGSAEALAERLGLALPGPGLWAGTQDGTLSAIWTGPDQWLVEFPGRACEDVAGDLAARAGSGVSITEQTGAFAAFRIDGPSLEPVLERLGPIDPVAVRPGTAHRTIVHHLGCILACRSENRLDVLGPGSAAAFVHHALELTLRRVVV